MATESIIRVSFNTLVTRGLFEDLLKKHRYIFMPMAPEIDDGALGIVLHTEKCVYLTFSKYGYVGPAIPVTLKSIPELEIMPTKEAFDTYLKSLLWCPDGH